MAVLEKTLAPKDGLRTRDATKYRYAAALAAIILVGVLFRVIGFTSRPLWDDEAWTYFIAARGLGFLFSHIHFDCHPPLFYAMEVGVIRLIGGSEWALRLPSLVTGILTIPLTAGLARRVWGEREALLAAALVAVSPELVYQSQEARSYSVIGFVFLLVAGTLWLYLEQPTWKRGLIVALVGCVAPGVHYLGVVFVPLAVLLVLARGRLRDPLAWLPLIPVAIVAAGFAWLRAHQERPGPVSDSLAVQLVMPVVNLAKGELSGTARNVVLVAFAFVLYVAFRGFQERRWKRALFPALLFTVPLVMMWIGTVTGSFPLRPAYVSPLAPALCLALAAGLAGFSNQKVGMAAAGVALIVGLAGSVPVCAGITHPNPDFRAAIDLVNREPADGVLLARGWGDLACYAYYQHAGPPVAVNGMDPAHPTLEEHVVELPLVAEADLFARSRRIWEVGKNGFQPTLDEVSGKLRAAGFHEVSRLDGSLVRAALWEKAAP